MSFKRMFVVMVSVLSMGSASIAMAGTVAGFGGATEITQLLNNVQLVMQYSTQLQQYESQLKNLVKQSDSIASNPSGYLSSLANIVDGGEAIGMGSARIANKLQQAYGSDYQKNAPYTGQDFETWMKTTKDSIRNAVRSVGVQQEALDSEADAIMRLKSMSGSSEGNLQVAQTGNQIALEMVQQMQKLRTMNMAQAQAMNARMLAVQNKEEEQRGQLDKFFNKTPKTYQKM